MWRFGQMTFSNFLYRQNNDLAKLHVEKTMIRPNDVSGKRRSPESNFWLGMYVSCILNHCIFFGDYVNLMCSWSMKNGHLMIVARTITILLQCIRRTKSKVQNKIVVFASPWMLLQIIWLIVYLVIPMIVSRIPRIARVLHWKPISSLSFSPWKRLLPGAKPMTIMYSYLLLLAWLKNRLWSHMAQWLSHSCLYVD